MIRTRVVVAAALVVSTVAAAAQTRPQAALPRSGIEQALAAFDQFFDRRLGEQGIVGASMALLHDHRTVHAHTYGYANLAARRPVDADTIFHWASITKTFTGIAIMQLRDRGLLSLDDPIVKYVPELREVHNPYGSMDATSRLPP